MYLLMAHVFGAWGIAGIDPHEECAVMFIEQIDKEFGEGTAYVVKLPDREDHTPTADAAEHHANASRMHDLLKGLQEGDVDLDAAFKNMLNEN